MSKKWLLFICFLFLIFYIASRTHFYEQFQRGKILQSISTESKEENIESELKIYFLDIGQGDATLIEFPNGEQMLVDCAIDSRILEALGRVMDFTDRTIEYLLVTHPDQDHYGGCIDVLNRFQVEHIFYDGFNKEKSSYFASFHEAIGEEKAGYREVQTDETLTLASTTIHFLYPDHKIAEDSRIPGLKKDTGTNNASIVFTLEYEGIKVLMTGDMEEELEDYLIQKYGSVLDSDVLKVGHHGSAGSSLSNFLNKVTPEYAVISAGAKNSYGHPSKRVLNRLARIQANVWRTDTQGDILLRVKNNQIYVDTSR